MWVVDRLAGVYAYLAVILRAAILIGQSIIFGGIVFIWFALQKNPASSSQKQIEGATRKCTCLLRTSALLLCAAHTLCLLINCRALIHTAGLTVSNIVGANFAIAAFIAICSALLMIPFSALSPLRTWPLVILSLLVLASSVMTNHASARIDNRLLLIWFTALHIAAAGAWIGGLPYLRLAVSAAPDQIGWIIAKRFSLIATLSVSVLAISGVAAAFKYVDNASGIYGTSYGVMLGAKSSLFGALLLLGARNHRAIRTLSPANLAPRLKRFVEAEIVIGITVILAAASLTSQPPAVDLKTDRASLSDIFARTRPTWPRLKTPDVKDISPPTRHLLDESASAAAAFPPVVLPNTPSDIAWSEYNHNWVGLMLFVMGGFALISRTGKFPISRHWPLMFLALALFIFVRADPENWPLGRNGFWESFDQIEVLQHRAAAAMVVAFGIFEWLVQHGKIRARFAPLVFPAVCVAGGALLLTHTHALQNSREQVLAELSHTPLAILAVLAGCSRWLELRLPKPDTKLAAHIWPVCFMLIGTLLLTYKEG